MSVNMIVEGEASQLIMVFRFTGERFKISVGAYGLFVLLLTTGGSYDPSDLTESLWRAFV